MTEEDRGDERPDAACQRLARVLLEHPWQIAGAASMAAFAVGLAFLMKVLMPETEPVAAFLCPLFALMGQSVDREFRYLYIWTSFFLCIGMFIVLPLYMAAIVLMFYLVVLGMIYGFVWLLRRRRDY